MIRSCNLCCGLARRNTNGITSGLYSHNAEAYSKIFEIFFANDAVSICTQPSIQHTREVQFMYFQRKVSKKRSFLFFVS